MGEIAEMMLDGTLCECCGEFIGEGDGFPQYCSSECSSGRGVVAEPTKKKEGKKRRQKRRKARKRLERLEKISTEFKEHGHLWWILSETHWRMIVNNKNLDYWPSTGTFSYDGKVNKKEHVYDFIEKANKERTRK